MKRSYTIFFLLMTFGLLGPISAFAQSAQQGPAPAIDAERRIVQNLAEGQPRYEGVTIRYAFRMTSEVGWTAPDDLMSAISARFEQVLSAELIPEGGQVLLCITTDGSYSNHEAYDQVLDQYGTSMARHSRTYSLK